MFVLNLILLTNVTLPTQNKNIKYIFLKIFFIVIIKKKVYYWDGPELKFFAKKNTTYYSKYYLCPINNNSRTVERSTILCFLIFV